MLKNGLYNLLGGLCRIGLGIATIPLLIRIIGVEEYGLWTLVSATVSLALLAEAGLSVSTTFFLSTDLANNDLVSFSEDFTIVLGLMLVFAFLAMGLIWFGAETFVGFFPNLSEEQRISAVRAAQLGGIVGWSRMIQQVFVGVEQVYDRYDVINVLNTLQSILFRVGLLFVAWLGGRIVALMFWQAIVTTLIMIVFAALNWILFRKNGLKLRFAIKWRRIRRVISYSSMTWLTSLGTTMFGQGDRVLVGLLLTPFHLGIYGAITDVTRQINIVSALPVQPLLPAIANFATNRPSTNPSIIQTVRHGLQANTLVALGIGGVLILNASLIMGFLLPDVDASSRILNFQIAAVIYSWYSMNAAGHFVLLGLGYVRSHMLMVTVSGLLSLLFIGLGARWWGITGAIIGNGAYLLVFSLTYYSLKWTSIRIKVALQWVAIPVLCFIIFSSIGLFLTDSQVNLAIALSLIYSLLLALWFVISSQIKFRPMLERILKLII